MKKTISMALVLVLAVLFSGTVKSEGENKYVDATGMAGIVKNDKGAARDRALEDARRKAVESVVGVLVDSETLVENFQLVSDRVYSQSAGYICGEKITNERQDEYNYYVTINACVQVGNLETNLLAIGICLRRLENPRTMLMIGEQNVGQAIHGWWQGSDLGIVEQALMDTFGEKGLPMIDPSVAAGNIQKVKAIGGEVDPSSASIVGKSMGAEYVVVGKALVTCKPRDQYDFYNCYANINLRIVKVDNGSIFGTATASAKSAHIEENESGVRALKKAAADVAPALLKKITQRCEKETTGGNEYKVVLTNVTNLGKLKDFMAKLQEERGVVSVTRRSFGGGAAEVEVMYKGRSGDLAEAIETATGASVTDFSANTIKVKLK